jgi:hypothetical protein
MYVGSAGESYVAGRTTYYSEMYTKKVMRVYIVDIVCTSTLYMGFA